MKRMLSLVLALVLAVGVVTADQDFALTTGKPVYTSGTSAGTVQVTLTNVSGEKTAALDYWTYLRVKRVMSNGSLQEVFSKQATSQDLHLEVEGDSQSWVWDKRDSSGKFVPTGSYVISLDPIKVGGKATTFSRTIALTQYGLVAGKSHFPLTKGNAWVYRTEKGTEAKMYVSLQGYNPKAKSPWYNVKNLVGAPRWVYRWGKPETELWASPQFNASNKPAPLFVFNKKIGYEYKVSFVPYLNKATLRVGAVNEEIETPAGKFACYRLDVVSAYTTNALSAGIDKFWFAPGVGLVQYTWNYSANETLTYSLHQAKVYSGMDKNWYTIGLAD